MINRDGGFFMKSIYTIGLTVAVFATLVGCGNSKKSSSNNGGGVIQGNCSQDTLNLFKELKRKSEQPITRSTRVNEIHRACLDLQSDLGPNACRDTSGGSRQDQFVAYSQVSNYCAEISTYVTQREPTPNPRPVPAPQPVPGNRPPQYQNTQMVDIDPRFSLYFEKSYLDADDLDKRNSQVRCQLSIPSRENGRLRNARARFTLFNVSSINGASTYNLTMKLTGSGDLIRLVCRSQKSRLTVQDVNNVLEGVAELRQR